MEKLKASPAFAGPKGPVVLTIMDGVGIGKYELGDQVRTANTPNLDWLRENAVSTTLKAHGTAVGMPSDDDMGNSEVGHNAIGAGRVFDQGASLVSKAISSGAIFKGDIWRKLIDNCTAKNSKLHLLGLFSDGNVHSHIDHLEAMLAQAKSAGVARACVHILLDGRDVPPASAHEYVERLEAFLGELNADGTADYAIASGGGRMRITMDRYEANWDMVRIGWGVHVRGEGEMFASSADAIKAGRDAAPGAIDQDLPPFVIERDGKPLGTITDGDSVIFFNFRGDRAIEISRAFEDHDFDAFDRGQRPDVEFAGMMQYDGDLLIPKQYLVSPPPIDRTMGEYLANAGVTQLAISETQKFGHVTYFFNGNRSGKFNDDLEDYVEIPSDIVPFELRPWMKAAEITDYVVDAIASGRHRFIRLNYPNGDMVGHTGIFPAVEIAVEAVDLCIGRLIEAVRKAEGILVISADHGNSDDMYERDKSGVPRTVEETGKPMVRTSHSLNPVPAIFHDPAGTANVRLADEQDLGISSLGATCLKLLGFEAPEGYDASVVDVG